MDLHTILAGALVFVGGGLCAVFPAYSGIIMGAVAALQPFVTRSARKAPAPEVKP